MQLSNRATRACAAVFEPRTRTQMWAALPAVPVVLCGAPLLVAAGVLWGLGLALRPVVLGALNPVPVRALLVAGFAATAFLAGEAQAVTDPTALIGSLVAVTAFAWVAELVQSTGPGRGAGFGRAHALWVLLAVSAQAAVAALAAVVIHATFDANLASLAGSTALAVIVGSVTSGLGAYGRAALAAQVTVLAVELSAAVALDATSLVRVVVLVAVWSLLAWSSEHNSTSPAAAV